ncbi:hypothetical protein EST38_g2241 [Candolleomyces aberdarensis]|uniref:Uncharacterized protein n=1 Tax=Candolleomyces aberdarensis TaxID=2316362 RepID=A0A4Q2DWI1_9AGAR|nr:hypothetical protein EST38_g2241 [Candolleomyces aberdarensis]
MSCMIYIAYRKYTNNALGNTLMTIFYRDGISYFVILSALATANIAVAFSTDSGLKFMLSQ